MAHACGEALGWEQEMLNDRSTCVTLEPGVCLDVRFLGVASVLRLLLLPPATQICGKRVFGMT